MNDLYLLLSGVPVYFYFLVGAYPALVVLCVFLTCILMLSLDDGVNVHCSLFVCRSTVSLGVLCVTVHC